MIRRTTSWAAIGAAVVLFVAAGTSAEAATERETDQAHDAWRVNPNTFEWEPAPTNATADIRSFTTQHNDRRVVFTARVRSDAHTGQVLVRVKTPTAEFQVAGDFDPTGARVTMYDDRGGLVGCRRTSFRIDRAADEYRMSVPRSCVGSPDWIRTGFIVSARNSAEVLFQDIARSDGHDGYAPLGARIRRS